MTSIPAMPTVKINIQKFSGLRTLGLVTVVMGSASWSHHGKFHGSSLIVQDNSEYMVSKHLAWEGTRSLRQVHVGSFEDEAVTDHLHATYDGAVSLISMAAFTAIFSPDWASKPES